MKSNWLVKSLTGITVAVSTLVIGLANTAPALASGGWGFGMDYDPPVMASCTSYNLIPVKVEVPSHYPAGYVSGILSNPRTGTAKAPTFGTNEVANVGSPTRAYIIFTPPTGTVEGDILHADMTLYGSPQGGVVGHFSFSYNCSTGEIIKPSTVQALNTAYGDDWVAVVSSKDSAGNPDVELWCLDPQGQASYINMTLSKASLASIPAYPASNTLIDQNNSCRVTVAAYALTTGQYQVTIGPDQNGVKYEVIFTGLQPTDFKFMRYNVNQGM